jgi:hypothetical protein
MKYLLAAVVIVEIVAALLAWTLGTRRRDNPFAGPENAPESESAKFVLPPGI